MRITKIICLIVLFFSINCLALSLNVKQKNITDDNFKELYANCYVIKFSNVFINMNNKRIKIPIFQGSHGDIDLEELEEIQKNKIFILSSLIFFSKKGELKKTLLDFLYFYKKSMLKNNDINKPTIIGAEGDSYIIWYDFVYEGMNSSMMIHLMGNEKNMDELDRKRINVRNRTIEMIELDESLDNFRVSIIIGEESPFFIK